MEQNGKTKHLNYTLMSLVCSISSVMHLPKTLWNEVRKTVVYFKNQSSSINSITPYKLGNHIWPNLSYLKVVGPYTWVYISKEKKIKLDVRF